METVPAITSHSFYGFMEYLPVGIAVIHSDTIIYSNQRASEIFPGITTGQHLVDLPHIHPEDYGNFINFFLDYKKHPDTTNQYTFRNIYSLSSEPCSNMWITCKLSSLNDPVFPGDYIVSFMDVTQLKEMEEQIRIEDKMATLGRISGEIAHEVRNPLSVININTDSLKEICGNADVPDYVHKMLQKIVKASGTIEKTIQRILSISKNHKPDLQRSSLNIPVAEAVELCSDLLMKNEIETKISLCETAPLCLIDEDLIQQVMINLISNSIEALADCSNRKVEISSYFDQEWVSVSISDSGQGIPPELRERVFDPFFTTKEDGTGIGLSRCARLIHQHNGTISVSESILGGAEVTIRIPSL